MVVRAAIYARISHDASGEGVGVADQEAQCRALAAKLGWSVVEVFVDNDLSAWRKRVRPEYKRMMAAVERREITGLLAYHPDRFYRRIAVLGEFIDAVRDAGCLVHTVAAGEVDLSTAAGRTTAGILGVVAYGESDRMSERIRRKLLVNATEGRPHGGMRPYGWNDDRLTLREDEAAVVREATDRILAGETLRAVFRDLNERGLYNASGNPWTHATFRGIVLRPRNAGLRQHQGEIVGDGVWERIVEPETWRALERALTNPARVTTPGRGGKLHLLSGIATCAVCGSALRVGQSNAGIKDGRRTGYPVYRCRGEGTHVTRRADALEDLVTRVVVERLSRPDARTLLDPPDDSGARAEAERELETVRQQLDDAAAAFAARQISVRQLAVITEQLQPELARLEAAAAPPPDRSRVLGALVGADDVRTTWDRLSPDVRRAVVALLLNIRVDRAPRGRGFRVEGIDISWR